MERAEPVGRSAAAVQPRLRAAAIGVAALVVVAYLCACGYLWLRQRALIFLPAAQVQATPADAGLPYENVRVLLGDTGAGMLHGWWLAVPGEGATMLYLHGNDVNLGGNVDAIARLHRMGFSVLAIDYRGYGASSGGFPSEAQVYEDADAAWRWLVRERHVDPARAFIYGHSLGGAVAIELALRHPEAAGVIVEAGFTSMAEMARIDYWMFPTDWILDQRFDALDKVGRLRVPVLFVHGTADREVPYTMSERLYAAAHAPKRLVLVPQGGHEDSAKIGAVTYTRAVLDFARRDDASRREEAR